MPSSEADSGDEFALELLTCHRLHVQTIAGAVGIGFVDEEGEDESFLRELLTCHRQVSLQVIGHPKTGENQLQPLACTDPAPVSSIALAAPQTSCNAAFSRIAGSRLVGRQKRRRSVVVEPTTATEAHSLQWQHGQVSTRCGHDPRICMSLCRFFFNMTERDCTSVALEGLADSVAFRIRGIAESTVPPAVFKVGLTRCPRWRFHEAPYAYRTEYSNMEVLVGSTVALIAWLEEAVIRRVACVQGCRNSAPGGESPPPPSMRAELYCVWKPVSSVIADRLQAVRKMTP